MSLAACAKAHADAIAQRALADVAHAESVELAARGHSCKAAERATTAAECKACFDMSVASQFGESSRMIKRRHSKGPSQELPPVAPSASFTDALSGVPEDSLLRIAAMPVILQQGRR